MASKRKTEENKTDEPCAVAMVERCIITQRASIDFRFVDVPPAEGSPIRLPSRRGVERKELLMMVSDHGEDGRRGEEEDAGRVWIKSKSVQVPSFAAKFFTHFDSLEFENKLIEMVKQCQFSPGQDMKVWICLLRGEADIRTNRKHTQSVVTDYVRVEFQWKWGVSHHGNVDLYSSPTPIVTNCIPPVAELLAIIAKCTRTYVIKGIDITSWSQDNYGVLARHWQLAFGKGPDLFALSKSDSHLRHVFENLEELSIHGPHGYKGKLHRWSTDTYSITQSIGHYEHMGVFKVSVADYPPIDLRHCKCLKRLALPAMRLTRVPLICPDVTLDYLNLEENLLDMSAAEDAIEIRRHREFELAENAITSLWPFLCSLDNHISGRISVHGNPIAPLNHGLVPVEYPDQYRVSLTTKRMLIMCRSLDFILCTGIAPCIFKDKLAVSQHWFDFLVRGLYDPRLFLLIWQFVTGGYRPVSVDIDDVPLHPYFVKSAQCKVAKIEQ